MRGISQSVLAACAWGAAVACSAGDGLVADPYRAVGVTWPKHVCMGQDYRFMFYRTMLDLADEKLQGGGLLKDEPFFREAGIADVPVDASFTGGDRRIEIRSVTCRDVDGKEVTGPRGPVKLAVSPEARDDFYKSVNVLFGASTPHPGYNFPGTCESLKFISKAVIP